MEGTIKMKNDEKWFGFISQDGGKNDYFFHKSDVVWTTFENLNKGDAVTFDVEQAPRGPKATNIQLV